MQETKEMRVESLGWEDPLEEEMVTHSSILDWKIPWWEKSGGVQSRGVQRVRHGRVTKQEHSKQAEKSVRYSLPCSFIEKIYFSSDFFQNSFTIFDFLKLWYDMPRVFFFFYPAFTLLDFLCISWICSLVSDIVRQILSNYCFKYFFCSFFLSSTYGIHNSICYTFCRWCTTKEIENGQWKKIVTSYQLQPNG